MKSSTKNQTLIINPMTLLTKKFIWHGLSGLSRIWVPSFIGSCNYPACMCKGWSNQFCRRRCGCSPNLCQTVQCHEKLSSVWFKSLKMAHEYRKSWVFTGHAYRPHLTYQCHVLFPLRMLDLKIDKGRRIIKSVSTSMHNRHYTALAAAHEATYPTLLLMVAMICALESSSYKECNDL